MRKIFVILFLLLSTGSAFADIKTVGQWNSATKKEKALASMQWAVLLNKNASKVELLGQGYGLLTCINKALMPPAPVTDESDVRQYAVMCSIMMKAQ